MGFSTRKLAYVLHSLVRVSRRVSRSHFDKISRRTLRPAYIFLNEVGCPVFSQSFSYSSDLILPIDSEKAEESDYKLRLKPMKYFQSQMLILSRQTSKPNHFLLLLPSQRFHVF
jgi:hypothetical protein